MMTPTTQSYIAVSSIAPVQPRSPQGDLAFWTILAIAIFTMWTMISMAVLVKVLLNK